MEGRGGEGRGQGGEGPGAGRGLFLGSLLGPQILAARRVVNISY